MSETKFTPGPYYVKRSASDHATPKIVAPSPNSGGEIIALVTASNSRVADLLASSPDLYDALDEMLSAYEAETSCNGGWDSLNKKARAALAKARGEK